MDGLDDLPTVTLVLNNCDYHIVRIDEAVAMCQAQDFRDITDEPVTSARIVTRHDLGQWDRTP